MILSNDQIANAFAIAQILGSDLSIEEFQKKYSEYYSEALNVLNSQPLQYAQCEALDLSKAMRP